MKTRTLKVVGKVHKSAHEALVELNFSGDHAISMGGKFLTITDAEYRRIQGLGVQPTTWHHHERTGRIVSVPGNCD